MPAAVTTEAHFIGREGELERLRLLLIEGAQGRGGTVLVEGPPGIGKEWLLERLPEVARGLPELEQAEFVSVYCTPNTELTNGWEPFGEILQLLTEETERSRDRRKQVLEIVRNYGPDLLALIPGFGAPLGLAAKAGSDILLQREEARRVAVTVDVPSQFERTLVKLAHEHKPLVLLVKQAHWMAASAAVLLVRLARRAPLSPLVIVVAHCPVDDEHPLRKIVRGEVGDLVAELELSGFTEDEVRRYVAARFGEDVGRELQPWLAQFADESPLFIAEYLALLEARGVIHPADGGYELGQGWQAALEQLPKPESVTKMLSERLSGLDDEERELLRLGSVQGQQFLSAVLAELGKKEQGVVLDQLAAVEERLRVIRFNPPLEQTAEGQAALYSFKPGLVQQLLYEQVKDPRRMLTHAEIASVLEHLIEGQQAPAQKWLLEIARHYREAGQPLPAAESYYRTAHASFCDGAFEEAAKLCEQGLALARTLQEGVEAHDRLRAELVDLLLASSEIRWRKGVDLGGLPVDDLAREGEAAAARTGDGGLQARLRFVRGKLLVDTDSLAAALPVLREALSLAEQAGDRVAQLVISTELGHHLDSEDLLAGREQLRKAEELAATIEPQPGLEATLLDRYVYRLKGAVGVAEFDLGNYGDALQRLPESVDGLRRAKAGEQLCWTLTFLGQLCIATGLYERAEAALREAVGLFAEEEEPSAARGYARMLLGKLYLEWDPPRVADAEAPIRSGWDESRAAAHAAVMGLAGTYYVEWLLARPGRSAADLDEADALLESTIRESEEGGWHRSAIAALSLRARAALLREPRTPDLLERAVAWSTEAAEYLERKGGYVPAVRSEEVLFAHHLVLSAAGEKEAAAAYLQKARKVVRRKAKSIADEEQKSAFLRVRLTREILGD